MTDTRVLIHALRFPSRLGWILLAGSSEGICLLDFCGADAPSDADVMALLHKRLPDATVEIDSSEPGLHQAKEAILRYLEEGTPLPELPLDLRFGTPFQQKVWQALRRIPHGETRSYLEIAQALNRPQSARAVGQSCGKNPIAILVPCHRVVTTGGKLGGYSGGLHIKTALLELERGSKRE